MIPTFGCIVEGHAEVKALPVLLRRVVDLVTPGSHVNIPEPIRVSRTRIVQPRELERAVALAALKAGPAGAVLVLLDSEDDCPRELAPALCDRARIARSDIPVGVVLARREYEAWFLAGARSLRGQRGLRPDIEPPPDVEGIRGAKEWLTGHMTAGRSYRQTRDQPALSAKLDLSEARGAPSFEKLIREVTRLLRALTRPAEGSR